MDQEDTIVVVGVGKADAEPDRVRAHVGVSTVAPTIAEALTSAAAAQQRIVDVLVDAGVTRSSIQTSGYNAGHDYEAPATSSRHRADASLQIVLPDIARAGDLLAAISDAAGESFRIHGVSQDVSDPEPYRRAARAAGVRLGRLRSLVEGDATGFPRPTGVRAMAAMSAAPGVEGGELSIHAAVTATYEILQ